MKFFGLRLNSKGQEVPDNTPVEIPLGYRNPPPLVERMRAMIKSELSMRAVNQGFESFEEANDFGVSDDEKDFPDEDDVVTPNDPNLEAGFTEAVNKLKAKYPKKEVEKGSNEQKEVKNEELHIK